MNLGEQLKLLRQDKQLSQPELAAKAGIEQSYLSKLENDKSIPSNDMLRKLLCALEVELETLLVSLSASSIQKISTLPDVEHWLSKQQQTQFQSRRHYLLIASALIVIATTCFYIGFSKLVFPEMQYEYFSHGIVKEGEPPNVFYEWHNLIKRNDPQQGDKRIEKATEMAQRKKPSYLLLDSYQGQSFVAGAAGGSRFYVFEGEKQVPNKLNAWLQILGVLLFSAGVMGFVLERKLFK